MCSGPGEGGFKAASELALRDGVVDLLDGVAQQRDVEGWLMEMAVAKNTAMWRWVGADHVPLRLEMCAAWLVDHPPPSFRDDEPEPVILPLPCFATQRDMNAARMLLARTDDLWYAYTRTSPMYAWVTVMSEPKDVLVNEDDAEYGEMTGGFSSRGKAKQASGGGAAGKQRTETQQPTHSSVETSATAFASAASASADAS